MSIEVKVPQLPESVTDATLIAWHKRAGDAVQRDENLVDLETDKVVLEVPAPSDGVLAEIKIGDGATVTSGQVLAVLDENGAASAGPASSKTSAEPPAEPAARTTVAAPPPTAPEADGARVALAKPASKAGERLGPAARRLVEEHDLEAGAIAGSGREGRVTKGDVLNYLKGAPDGEAHEEPAKSSARPASMSAEQRAEQRVRMTRLRARIAERLIEAQQTAAMLTTFNEADMSAVMELRARYRDEFQERYGIKLGFMSFFVKAAIEALRKFPVLNASLDGQDIVYHEFFDIGVAVSTDRGLIVPILRNAELQSFGSIETAIADFGERARSGAINMEELTGGTFTITNGGIFGSLMSTPILNPPQSGILGMHKIQERPVVVDGNVVVRPMMYLALTYDHRLVDGREAVQFLVALKELLEDPARLMLQV
ncbi:MAG TPA: 2-oxoglutarate dehydrogenase complex dihydrolipoyllysine-residue succinyltransferase [Gammaproteobacteria bacterium]|nr:2-oxoglutarate dehydrogenase complex dihydrolipoyllysine-residue succinyltransferase [Gammaproteobacteria bacterium]